MGEVVIESNLALYGFGKVHSLAERMCSIHDRGDKFEDLYEGRTPSDALKSNAKSWR